MTETIQILGLPFSTFTRAVMLLCEEKSIPYRCEFAIDNIPIELHSSEHKNIHPFAKFPAIKVADQVLCETAPILRYLDSQYPGASFTPELPIKKALVEQWCNFISIYIDKALVRDVLLEFAMPKGPNGEVRIENVQAAIPLLKECLSILNSQLEGNKYLCTEKYSLADMVAAPMLAYLKQSPLGGDLLPCYNALNGYVDRVLARPASQKILLPFNN